MEITSDLDHQHLSAKVEIDVNTLLALPLERL